MCTLTQTTVFLGLHTILHVFELSGRETEGGRMLDRGYCHERESSDTVLEWDSSAVFPLWPSWRVSNQKLWNGVMNLPGRLMSSLLGKKVNHVLSLLWAVLGNLSHILESVEGRKCRGEPVDKCVTEFGLYMLREAGQLHREIFDCWQRAYKIIMLIFGNLISMSQYFFY